MHLMTLSTIKSIFRWFYVLLCLCENRYPENKFIIVFNVLVCGNESSSNRSITRSNHNIWITVDIFVCENRELISFLPIAFLWYTIEPTRWKIWIIDFVASQMLPFLVTPKMVPLHYINDICTGAKTNILLAEWMFVVLFVILPNEEQQEEINKKKHTKIA